MGKAASTQSVKGAAEVVNAINAARRRAVEWYRGLGRSMNEPPETAGPYGAECCRLATSRHLAVASLRTRVQDVVDLFPDDYTLRDLLAEAVLFDTEGVHGVTGYTFPEDSIFGAISPAKAVQGTSKKLVSGTAANKFVRQVAKSLAGL